MTARWLMLWLSLAGVLLGMTLLLLFIEYFAVPQFLTGAFQPAKCKLVGFRFVPFKNSAICNNTGTNVRKHSNDTTDKMPDSNVGPTTSTFSSAITHSGDLDIGYNTSVDSEHIGSNSLHEESNCLQVSAFNYMKCIEQSSGYFTQSNRHETESGSQLANSTVTESGFSESSNTNTMETHAQKTDDWVQFEQQNIVTKTAFGEQNEQSRRNGNTETTDYVRSIFPNGTTETIHELLSAIYRNNHTANKSDINISEHVSKETSNILLKKGTENVKETISNRVDSFGASRKSETFSSYKDNSPFLQDITTEAILYFESQEPSSQSSEDKSILINGSNSMNSTNHIAELPEVAQFRPSNKSDQLHSSAVKNDSEACNIAQQCAVLDVSIDEKNQACSSSYIKFTDHRSILSLLLL